MCILPIEKSKKIVYNNICNQEITKFEKVVINMSWFVRMWIIIAIVFVGFGLATLLEKYDTQVINAVKKILRFFAEMADDALVIVLALLVS